jgi:hypothetical protein
MTAIAGRPERRWWTPVVALTDNHDFRLLWIGQMASELGSSISSLALPLLALVITGSRTLAGALATVSFMTMWLSALPGGYIADRFNGRTVMVLSDIARAVALGTVAISVPAGFASFWLLVLAAIVVGVADMLFGPAIARAIRAVVRRDEIAEAVAISQARSYAADLVGPAASGLLFALGRAIPFAVDAISYLASLGCTLRLRTRLQPAEPPEGRLRFFPAVAAGWTHVRRDAFLTSSTVYSTVMNVAVSTLVFVLILGEGGRSRGALVVGGAMSLAAGAGMVGSLIAPAIQRRLGLRTVLVAVAATRTLLVLGAAVTGSPVALALALASVVFLSPVTGAVLGAARMLLVPHELFGRVTGTISFIATALQPAAPLVAGLLIANLSQQDALLALVAVFGAVTLFAVGAPGFRVEPEASPAMSTG